MYGKGFKGPAWMPDNGVTAARHAAAPPRAILRRETFPRPDPHRRAFAASLMNILFFPHTFSAAEAASCAGRVTLL
ncbi:MAG: hypothetical protein EBU57_02905 [Alphaproteobacteria bacterium]|nr:hypothetical protein [Alphaproteobacteria bacterium]